MTLRQTHDAYAAKPPTSAVSVGAATELLPMPADKREQFLTAVPEPSMREARAADALRPTFKMVEIYIVYVDDPRRDPLPGVGTPGHHDLASTPSGFVRFI